MDTETTVFSGQPDKGTDQSSHSSNKTPAPDGPTASANRQGQTGDIRHNDPEAGGAHCPAPSTVAIPEPFNLHLNHLKNTNRRTLEILSRVCPGHTKASGAMEAAWDLVYKTLDDNEAKMKEELPTMNTLASVIQKLMSASTQIKNLELKVHDQERDEEDRQVKKAEILSVLSKSEGAEGIRQDTLHEIEQLLKLL